MNTILQKLTKSVLEQAAADGANAGGGAGEAGGEQNQNQDASSADQAALQERARSMGWAPKDQWRGDPQNWLDAGEYVQRGEQILPILRSNLQRTEAELTRMRADFQRQSTLLQAANESIQVLTNLSTEQSRETAREKRRELLRQQAQARTDGNAELEIDLGEQIADVTAEINSAETAVEKPAAKRKTTASAAQATESQSAAPDPTTDPAYQAFVRDNPWFGTDHRRSALAVAIGRELKQDPATQQLVGAAFFNRIVSEVNKIFSPQQRGSSKVEGGVGGGTSNGSGSGSDSRDAASGKAYADLPADAKAACDRQANWVVGEGRAFKDVAAWRKHYVTVYFNS